jgi:glycosyltransferase involved in cell wall biosynthesis
MNVIKDTMPHILFALESFFPSHRAGTEVYVLNLCRYFKSRGWTVSVLITTTEDTKDYEYEDIPIHTFTIPTKPNAKELNGLIKPRGILHFVERLDGITPDIVHFHSFGRAINGFHLKAAKQLGYKTVFTPHLGSQFCIKGNMRLFDKTNCNGEVKETRCMSCLLYSKGHGNLVSKVIGAGIGTLSKYGPLQNAIPPSLQQAKHRKNELNRIAKYADLVFSIAPWIQKAFEANNINEAILIPQGISPVFFEKLESASTLQNETHINFVFVGRMHSSKGFHLLKQAWDQLKSNTRHKLHIITNPSGDENEYFKLHKAWAKAHTTVVWNEGLSQQEVALYLNNMDVLVLPSISNEVAPLVILEAATRNIPVIASNYIAMIDMVDHEVNGLLFENGNSQELYKHMLSIINKPKLLEDLKRNVQPPLSMFAVAEIIEEKISKL